MLGYCTLFFARANTDTGSKSFHCALISTLETNDDPEKGNYYHDLHISHVVIIWNISIIVIIRMCQAAVCTVCRVQIQLVMQ
jgi:K+-transporting ATPase A subunit